MTRIHFYISLWYPRRVATGPHMAFRKRRQTCTLANLANHTSRVRVRAHGPKRQFRLVLSSNIISALQPLDLHTLRLHADLYYCYFRDTPSQSAPTILWSYSTLL